LKDAVQWSASVADLQMMDPKLLAWLWEPQLVYRDEKQLSSYNLQVLLPLPSLTVPKCFWNVECKLFLRA
jgi:hypothetical protein